MSAGSTPTGPGAQARNWMSGLDRRYLPVAAAALERLMARTSSRPVGGSRGGSGGSRLALAPDARRVLGALAVVLLISALALVVIGA